jgi:hypothetical protein
VGSQRTACELPLHRASAPCPESGQWAAQAEALKPGGVTADSLVMNRSVIGLTALVGTTIGGFLPELWGDSGMSLVSLAFAAVGGVAGVWLGARLSGAL